MSDDEEYDADADVGRFLQCPSPGGHMFPLSQPDGGQYAPPTHVQPTPAPAAQGQGQPAPPQTLNPAPDFGVQNLAAIYYEHDDEAPPAIYSNAQDHHQLPASMDVDDQYQDHAAAAMDVQPPPRYGGFPDRTLLVLAQGDDGVVHGDHYYQVRIMGNQHYPAPTINDVPPPVIAEHHQDQEPIMDAEHYGAAIVDGGHHQVPAMDDVHYEAPPINAEHHRAPPSMDVEPPPQYEAMAMDVVPPATQMPQASGGFPNPTTPWLEGSSSMFSDPPSPTMCRMLDELAAMLQGVDGGEDGSGGGAEAAAEGGGDNAAAGGADEADESDDEEEEYVGPDDDEVKFKPLTHGQLDCSRCHSVREVLAIDWPSKIHFAVHSTYPETFEHAVTHRSLMGQDGQFHTYALLYMDLRGRRNEWVEGFIAKSVDTMKRRNAGMVHDTNDASTSNHGHMGLEVAMLNNLLSSATAATAYQAANPQAVQPVQEQGNTDAAHVAEEDVHEAASSEAAIQPPVSQAQLNTTDALSVAEAAAPEAADEPEVAATVTLRVETRTDALDRFPAFNWEGFKPDILESSQVEPYDPASGVNVLLYPSMLEQLQLEELKKKESKKLSKMTVEDTPDYLNINDDHYANAPNFASSAFKLLCQKDPTYRMFKRRVSGLNRKIKKLEQGSKRVGTGGLFKIKQKMETCKQEKEELYDVIKRGMLEIENERHNNNGAGPSNHAAGPSNSSPGPFIAGPSNVASTSSSEAGPSNVSGSSSNDAGPSNVAGTSNSAASPSNVAAGPSGTN
ncbi:unnamed protein product [Urochloa decumbens]|uniref:Uncharacterized protein n=1 Tax=Urochloa decumbens TaxID=240449 RepID=A0ABC8W6L9_9POAL